MVGSPRLVRFDAYARRLGSMAHASRLNGSMDHLCGAGLRQYARPAYILRSCTSASACSPHLSSLTVTALGCAQASYIENIPQGTRRVQRRGMCCCWMWREGDLRERVSAALVVECWISAEIIGEVSFASIVARLKRTAGCGRAGLSWPQGWEGSGLAEWVCDVLLQTESCTWTRQPAGRAAGAWVSVSRGRRVTCEGREPSRNPCVWCRGSRVLSGLAARADGAVVWPRCDVGCGLAHIVAALECALEARSYDDTWFAYSASDRVLNWI